MSTEHHVAWLSSLSAQQRGIFLAAMIHNLTLAMRVVCHGGDGESRGIERARALNEAIHAASKHLLAICSGDEDPRWIQPTARALFLADDPVILDQVNQCWVYSQHEVAERSLGPPSSAEST